MEVLNERQETMLKVLSLNNGPPINVGLSELCDKDFSDLLKRELVYVFRGSDNIVWARISTNGAMAITSQAQTLMD